MSERLHTVADLTAIFGKSRQGIHDWIKQGRFPNSFTVGEGAGMVLVPASDVEKVRKEEAAKLIEQLNRLGFQTVPA